MIKVHRISKIHWACMVNNRKLWRKSQWESFSWDAPVDRTCQVLLGGTYQKTELQAPSLSGQPSPCFEHHLADQSDFKQMGQGRYTMPSQTAETYSSFRDLCNSTWFGERKLIESVDKIQNKTNSAGLRYFVATHKCMAALSTPTFKNQSLHRIHTVRLSQGKVI